MTGAAVATATVKVAAAVVAGGRPHREHGFVFSCRWWPAYGAEVESRGMLAPLMGESCRCRPFPPSTARQKLGLRVAAAVKR